MSLYSTKPMKVTAIRKLAYRMAREAGLDTTTADAVAHKVTDSLKPHISITDHITRVIQEHAHP